MAKKQNKYTKEKSQLLHSLLSQARKKGYIQAKTITSRFSRYSPSEEEMEEYFEQFKDAGIDVIFMDPSEESCEGELIDGGDQTPELEIPKPDPVSSSLIDPLQLYLNEIHKYPTLTYKETIALVHKIMEGDKNAREYLINCNLKFAFTVALKYVNCGLPLLDIVQQANIGLTVAADRYRPQRGTRFSSYAVFWIKQSILLYINECSRLIRLPEYISIDMTKLHNCESAFIAEHQRKPTDDELATLSGFAMARVKYLRGIDFNIISTELQPDEEMDGTIEDTLTDYDTADDPHKELYHSECRTMIFNLLMKLTPRQRDVITLRFGLNPEENTRPLSLDETGKILGVSKERVRQLENMALNKLRRMPGITALYSYLEL